MVGKWGSFRFSYQLVDSDFLCLALSLSIGERFLSVLVLPRKWVNSITITSCTKVLCPRRSSGVNCAGQRAKFRLSSHDL